MALAEGLSKDDTVAGAGPTIRAHRVGTDTRVGGSVPARHADGTREGGTTRQPLDSRARGLTLRLQVTEQWLGVVQGAGGEAAHAVLSQAAGRAQ